jgi:transcriptional regulator with XRE-family HTH domain
MDAMTIGQRIRRERVALGIKRDKLAAFMGIAPSTLGDLENDYSTTTTKLHLAAEMLGVSTRWLETGVGPRRTEAAAHHTVSVSGVQGATISQSYVEPAPIALGDGSRVMLSITFADIGIEQLPLALAFAQSGRPAEYSTRSAAGIVWHVASFTATAEQANDALILMRYTGLGSGVVVRAGGRIARDPENVRATLDCYTEAVTLGCDHAYCHRAVQIGEPPQAHELPCARLVALAQAPGFWQGDLDRSVQLAAVRAECEWCPYFKPDEGK